MSRSPLFRVVAAALVGLLAGAPATGVAAAANGDAGETRQAKGPTLAVVAFAVEGAPAATAAQLSLWGERAAREIGRHELRELAPLLDPAASRAREEKAAEGKAAYEAARKAYDELDMQKAAELSDKALQAYERSDLSVSFEALLTAWTLRIAALFGNGEAGAAGVELGLLMPVGGRAVFDPNMFAPDHIAQVKARREEQRGRSDLGLEVASQPASARVFVDGELRGVAPLKVEGLAPGDHFLTLVAPGYQRVQKRVRPGPGAVESVQLEPAPRLAAFTTRLETLRRDLHGKGRDAAAGALAQELGVDQVLAVALLGQGKALRARGLRVDRGGKLLSFLEELLPAEAARIEDAATTFLRRIVAADLQGGAIAGDGFWRAEHTGMLLLGLGVGAAAAGGLLGLQAKGAADDFKRQNDLPQSNPAWDSRASGGRTFAIVADVSYLLAAVLVGTGTYFTVTGLTAERDEPRPYVPIPAEERKAEPARADPSPEAPRSRETRREEERRRREARAEERRRAEEAKAAERRKADEAKKAAADEKRQANEVKAADEKRRADEAKAADEKRRADEAKAADEKRRSDETRAAEEKRRVEDAKAAEEKRRLEEQRKKDREIEDFDDLRDDR